MRIVGGRHRGRPLAAPPGRSIRPTSDRIREAVFNILAHGGWAAAAGDGEGAGPVVGATVLDAFAGTGALALEALSRGAARATLIDQDPAALDCARRNAASLGEAARVTLIRADATDPPPAGPAQPGAGLAFLDPPYKRDLAAPALAALAEKGWLAAGCLAIVELARTEDPPLPAGFQALAERRYGDTKILFLRWEASP